MVEDIAEQTVEDVEGSVNLGLLITLDELEEQVEQVLPDASVLFSNHSALDLDGDIANLVHVSLVSGINFLDHAQNLSLDRITNLV